MSQKKAKQVRSIVKKQTKQILINELDAVIKMRFRDRLKFALIVIRGKRLKNVKK